MQQRFDGFTAHRVGTAGCEIRGPDGLVVAWSVDEMWASVLVDLLNGGPALKLPNTDCCCDGPGNRGERCVWRSKNEQTEV